MNNQNTTAYRSNKLYYSDNSYSSNNKCLIRALTKFYMTLHNNDHVILILLCKMYLMEENITVFWQIKYNSSNIFSSNHDYRMTIPDVLIDSQEKIFKKRYFCENNV